MPLLPLLLLLTSSSSGLQELGPSPVVVTENGPVQGFRVRLEPPALLEEEAKFSQADIFLGIPFAQAPVDGLRLERPRPPGNWSGTLDASSIPPACVPQHVLAAPDFSEDCLHLNLFRPALANSSHSSPRLRPFPVLVFIHGGGFAVGGTFVEGFANVSNNFVSQGILVVSLQYRLNFLGFFSDGSALNPGNLGLWDQRQALLWVHANVGQFGGDPGRVTLWGQSAGAASVSLLSVSPKSRDLFQQAIQLSGSLLSPWALNDRVVDTSMDTAGSLGCPRGPAQRQCLQRLELDELADGIQKLEIVRSDFAMVVYNPRVDDDFVPRDARAALASAQKKPTLMGFNPHESLFLTIHYPASVFAFDSPLTVANLTAYNRSQLVQFIRGCVQMDGPESEQELARGIAAELEQFYAQPGQDDWRHLLEQYTQLLSDIQFIVPLLAEARLKASHGWPLFLYQFDHVSREHAKKLPFRGVVHAAEYPYTLGTELFGNYALDEEDRRVQALLLRALGSFIKDGRPSSPPGLKWPSLGPNPKSPLQMALFKGSKVQLESEPEGLMRKIRFWRRLARKKGFQRVNGFPKAVP